MNPSTRETLALLARLESSLPQLTATDVEYIRCHWSGELQALVSLLEMLNRFHKED